MSVENLKAFGRLIAADAAVKEAVKAIGTTNVEGLIAYATERGLPFDAEDMRALAKQTGLGQDELNEEQLQSVAGGFITTTAAALVGLAQLAGAIAAGVVVGGAAATGDDW